MSRYISNLIQELENKRAPYIKYIMRSEHNENNNSGYAYLPSGRCNTHYLVDGRYIKEGLAFSLSKSATVSYFYVYSKDGKRLN